MFKKVLVFLVIGLFIATAGYAKEVGGVNLPEKMSAGGTNLILNGAGIRTAFFIKTYVAGLYLPRKSSDAQASLNADEPMALKLQVISGLVDSKKLKNAMEEGFEKSTNGNTAPLKPRIDKLLALFSEPIKVNDVVDFVYVPGAGIQITKNGAPKSTVEGLDFKKAFFGIWLGEKPAQDSLKKAMLGK